MQHFDFLVVGTGLFGAVFAQQAIEAGKTCLVVDRRPHIAGNCHTIEESGIHVHAYGPHLFHTSNEAIWRYVNRFAEFNTYRHKVLAKNGERVFSMPIGLQTLNQLHGITTPAAARDYFERVREDVPGDDIESWCLRTIGRELYELFIRDYTQKQWNRHPRDLPSSIVKRLPVRLTWDSDYSTDIYQGVPVEGYTAMVERMFEGATVLLETDYLKHRAELNRLARRVVYSGPIDELFNFDEGRLEYRSLRFEHAWLPTEDFQGCGQVNHTSAEVSYTRITEHKHFVRGPVTKSTIITREYPSSDGEPAYPINDEKNNALAQRYIARAKAEGYTVGGRLGVYRYYDMDQVIGMALKKAKDVLSAS